MGESIVQKKLGKLIQQELSEILGFKSGFLPQGLLTVSQVRVTADLGLAKVYVSFLPDSQLEAAAHALNEHSWEIRKQLAARIRNKVRKIPELNFYADDSYREADRINRMLDEVMQEVPPEEE
jgi:ribosome-binding factor A